MRRLALSAASLTACVFAGLALAAGTYKVGDDVADVTLAMSDGKDATLSAFDGNAVVLHFYGTWERNAVADARQVDVLRAARAKQQLVVLGVARDAKVAAVRKFAEDANVGFAQAADPKGEFYGRFATKGLPWIAILDKGRKLRHSAAGIDDDAIEVVLTELLGPKDPPPEKKKDEPPAGAGGKK